MTDAVSCGVHCLPVPKWPPTDAAAWKKARDPGSSLLRQMSVLSPASYRKYETGYGIFLWYLDSRGQCIPSETPAERVTLERLDGFYQCLRQCGNADYTIVGRFEELRGALQLMHPERDFTFVTRPQNLSIRRRLRMRRRDRFIPDFREVVLWAVAMFDNALTLADPARRRVQVRDAAIIGVGASRGPRLRALTGMQLGQNLIRSGDTWDLFFDEPLMKGDIELELPNHPRVSAILDRYVTLERQELLNGQAHDCLWVAAHGGPLSYKAIQYMFRVRTKARFGVSFGPHRLRHSIITTTAIIDGTNPFAPPQVLGHSQQTALKNYNRATALEASRRQDASMSEAEDAALRMLGPQFDQRVNDPPVLSIGELSRRRELRPSPQLNLFGPPALVRGKALTPARIRRRRGTV
jgi:integrase